MENRLEGQLFYLAGPMDRVPDRGVEWRKDIQQFLWDLGAGVFNPCDKPIDWGVEDPHSRKWRKQSLLDAYKLEKAGKHHDSKQIYDAISQHVKDIVASDLRGIDVSNAVIMYIDVDVHMCGSYNEQTHACLQRKPVIICCKQGKHNVPDWLFGICHHEMFFSNWNEVKKYLEHVAYDNNVKHYKRWRFIDYDKAFNNLEF